MHEMLNHVCYSEDKGLAGAAQIADQIERTVDNTINVIDTDERMPPGWRIFTDPVQRQKICLALAEHMKEPKVISHFLHQKSFILGLRNTELSMRVPQNNRDKTKLDSFEDDVICWNVFYYLLPSIGEKDEQGRIQLSPCKRMFLKWLCKNVPEVIMVKTVHDIEPVIHMRALVQNMMELKENYVLRTKWLKHLDESLRVYKKQINYYEYLCTEEVRSIADYGPRKRKQRTCTLPLHAEDSLRCLKRLHSDRL